jgi:hypothetical protein
MTYRNQQVAGMERGDGSARYSLPVDEEQRTTYAMIQRILVQFHRDWTELRGRRDGERWRSAANALLDRYSHELYDLMREVQAVLEEDLAGQIRDLSADMITTTNILYMIGYDDEYRKRGDSMAHEAIRYAEVCVLRRKIRHEESIAVG